MGNSVGVKSFGILTEWLATTAHNEALLQPTAHTDFSVYHSRLRVNTFLAVRLDFSNIDPIEYWECGGANFLELLSFLFSLHEWDQCHQKRIIFFFAFSTWLTLFWLGINSYNRYLSLDPFFKDSIKCASNGFWRSGVFANFIGEPFKGAGGLIVQVIWNGLAILDSDILALPSPRSYFSGGKLFLQRRIQNLL